MSNSSILLSSELDAESAQAKEVRDRCHLNWLLNLRHQGRALLRMLNNRGGADGQIDSMSRSRVFLNDSNKCFSPVLQYAIFRLSSAISSSMRLWKGRTTGNWNGEKFFTKNVLFVHKRKLAARSITNIFASTGRVSPASFWYWIFRLSDSYRGLDKDELCSKIKSRIANQARQNRGLAKK